MNDRAPAAITGRRILTLVLLLAIVWFGGLGFRKLIKPDEGRYAEIPRELVASGDWLVPRLNGLKYYEKPPLQYWTTAAAYEAFGIREWTSRLWTALTGFCGIVVVGWTTARLHDRRTGLIAATVLASSLAYVLLGHFNTLDMGLTFFMTVTLCATLLANVRASGAAQAPAHCGGGADLDVARSRTVVQRWILVAWLALGLATLSKGPVALVLAGGACVLHAVVTWRPDLLRRMVSLRGIALFVVVTGPWFVAISKADPAFARFFFIHEHVERFLTTEHRREGPVWYFVPVLVVGVLPWLSLLPTAFADALRTHRRGAFSPAWLLVAYVAVVFVFFSLSGSKLPSYVLPVFPALAMLLAPTLARISGANLRRHLVFVAVLAAAVIVAFFVVPLDSAESPDAIARFRIAAAVAMLPWLAGTLWGAVFAARRRVLAALLAAGIGASLGWASLLVAHETLGRGMSTYDLALAMRPYVGPDTPIYSVGTFEHTLDFYLQRTVTLVAFRDELDFGLTQEPQLGVPTLAAFVARWQADAAPLGIMGQDVFATLSRSRLPMRVVARDGRRVVVAKPQPPLPDPPPETRP